MIGSSGGLMRSNENARSKNGVEDVDEPKSEIGSRRPGVGSLVVRASQSRQTETLRIMRVPRIQTLGGQRRQHRQGVANAQLKRFRIRRGCRGRRRIEFWQIEIGIARLPISR